MLGLSHKAEGKSTNLWGWGDKKCGGHSKQESIMKNKRKESLEANSAWELAKIGSVQAACLRPIRLL